jgi:Uma2 family endonuclease
MEMLSTSTPLMTPRRLRRQEYAQLVSLGAFDGEKIELIRGALNRISPARPPHSSVIEELTDQFAIGLKRRARVRVQCPFVAVDDSEPEPDLAIVLRGDHHSEHPDSALLIVEVADSSLRYDREVKGPLYAESRVGEYWIVAIDRGCIEVYRDPADGRWNTSFIVGRDGSVSPLAFPDLVINVGGLLP